MRFECGKCGSVIEVTAHDDMVANSLATSSFERLTTEHEASCTGTGTGEHVIDTTVTTDAPPVARLP